MMDKFNRVLIIIISLVLAYFSIVCLADKGNICELLTLFNYNKSIQIIFYISMLIASISLLLSCIISNNILLLIAGLLADINMIITQSLILFNICDMVQIIFSIVLILISSIPIIVSITNHVKQKIKNKTV